MINSNLIASWCLDLAELAFRLALYGLAVYGVLHLFGVIG